MTENLLRCGVLFLTTKVCFLWIFASLKIILWLLYDKICKFQNLFCSIIGEVKSEVRWIASCFFGANLNRYLGIPMDYRFLYFLNCFGRRIADFYACWTQQNALLLNFTEFDIYFSQLNVQAFAFIKSGNGPRHTV